MVRFSATYTPTAHDAVTAYRLHERRPRQAHRLYIFGGVLMLLVFTLIGVAMDFLEILVLGAVLSPIFFVGSWMRDRAVNAGAKKQTYEELSVLLTESGISTASENWRSERTWATVTTARVDECGLLLYSRPGGFEFIPARAFGVPFPEAELRRFLESKVRPK